MAQNLVIANKDNLVVYVFGGIDLTLATDIQVQFGAESYSLINDPLIVIVTSATELSLSLSATAEVGKVFSTVTYFDGASVLGTDITSRELGNSNQIIVAIGTQLIIEDGTIVANANSIASDAEMKSYASLRGLSVPATQPEREALLVLAMDYLQSVENRMQGTRTVSTQSLPQPRQNVYLYGDVVDQNTIPIEYKNAQIEAAIAANDQGLLINSTSQDLASFTVNGVYAETYFEGGSWEVVRTDRIDAALAPLMTQGGFSQNARVL
jgi:hypothetical protein